MITDVRKAVCLYCILGQNVILLKFFVGTYRFSFFLRTVNLSAAIRSCY